MHKKFRRQWIKHHHFTNVLVKGTKIEHMSKNLIPIKNQPSKKFWKKYDKKVEVQMNIMQKFP
jgi:hypothetical protein